MKRVGEGQIQAALEVERKIQSTIDKQALISKKFLSSCIQKLKECGGKAYTRVNGNPVGYELGSTGEQDGIICSIDAEPVQNEEVAKYIYKNWDKPRMNAYLQCLEYEQELKELEGVGCLPVVRDDGSTLFVARSV